MEIVGVIAAVPELVKIVRETASAIGRISSKARTAKVAQGVKSHLDLLDEILGSIKRRQAGNLLTGGLSAKILPVIRDIRIEVLELQQLVNQVHGSDGGPGVLKRAQLALSGFEKRFVEKGRRIESLKSTLQIYLSESILQFNHRSQLRKLLGPLTTDFIPRKLEGTLEWIWTHHIFSRWMSHPAQEVTRSPASTACDLSERIMAIYGVKGCGKSVLAASIAEGLRQRGHTSLFFSFWVGHEHERRLDAMLRAILWQLHEGLSAAQRTRHTERLLDKAGQVKDSHELIREIQVLSNEHTSDVFCVLDGIDESADDWNDARGGPLDHLEKWLQCSSRVKLILVGRQSSLRLALRKWPRHFELTQELVHDDLLKLISSELDNCTNITDQATRDSIRKNLESRSGAMFLWIKLVFKELRVSFSSAEIYHNLNHVPNELDREYFRLFSKLTTRLHGRPNLPSAGMQRTKGLMSLLISACRPLSITEFRLAYSFMCRSGIPEDELVSEEGVIDACGDFITLDKGTVYLGHSSVREFLLRPIDQWDGQDSEIAYFRLDLASCHAIVGAACLDYIKQVEWQEQEESSTPGTLASRYPLLRYASSYMASHLLNSNMQIQEASSHLHDILHSKSFLSWLFFVIACQPEDDDNAPPDALDSVLRLLIAMQEVDSPSNGTTSPWLDQLLWIEHTGHGDTAHEDLLACLFGSRNSDVEDSGAAYNDLLAYILGSRSSNAEAGSAPPTLANSDALVTKPNISKSSAEQVQTAMRKFVSSNSKSRLAHLVRIPSMGKACMRQVDALVHPLDILLQSMEKSLQGLSFIGLIALALTLWKTRPRQAFRMLNLALGKVQGRGYLREALVHSLLGDILRLEMRDEDPRHLGSAETHYQSSMDILKRQPANALYDCWWSSAACCRAHCLFNLKKTEEARVIASEAETKLIAKQFTRQAGGSILKDWCNRRLYQSDMFKHWRMLNTVMLSEIYDDYGLDEDIERLLGAAFRDRSRIAGLGPKYRFQVVERFTSSLECLGKEQEALEAWRNCKNTFENGSKKDYYSAWVAWSIARISTRRHKFEDAKMELASINYTELLEVSDDKFCEEVIRCVLETYLAMGRNGESIQILQSSVLPAVELSFASAQRPLWEGLRVIHEALLPHCFCDETYGLFEMVERYIRRLLHALQAQRSYDFLQEIKLHVDLALSLRFQFRRPKRPDAFSQYLICQKLVQRLGQAAIPWNLEARICIGIGITGAETGMPHEAAEAFDKAAILCMDNVCGLDCIHESYRLFFTSQACIQRKKLVDAIVFLSIMMETLDPAIAWSCHADYYSRSILAIIGCLHLADMFDRCGIATQGDVCRRKALTKLQDEFYGSSSNQIQQASFWARWVDSCLAYVQGRLCGRIGTDSDTISDLAIWYWSSCMEGDWPCYDISHGSQAVGRSKRILFHEMAVV